MELEHELLNFFNEWLGSMTLLADYLLCKSIYFVWIDAEKDLRRNGILPNMWIIVAIRVATHGATFQILLPCVSLCLFHGEQGIDIYQLAYLINLFFLGSRDSRNVLAIVLYFQVKIKRKQQLVKKEIEPVFTLDDMMKGGSETEGNFYSYVCFYCSLPIRW